MTKANKLDRVEAPEAAEDAAGLTFMPVRPDHEDARIKVIGVGGGGGNATQRMERDLASHVEVYCINTDAQVLRDLKVGESVQIGRETTHGLGAGADPEVGRQAALESRDLLAGLVENTDMLFVTAGMGGGTGTGAAPVIAGLAREAGVLTVAVVTRPFSFEGQQRCRLAEEGIQELSAYVDSIITIPNDRLMSELDPEISLEDAFLEADKVLHGAVCGISDLILRPGTINVDFADVRTVMKQQGMAMMGTGTAEGPNRAVEATQQAINCRLLDEVNITDAPAMLVNVTTVRKGAGSLSLPEFNQIARELEPLQAENVQLVMGTTYDEDMGEELKVTLVVAGFGSKEEQEENPGATPLRKITEAPNSIRERMNGNGAMPPEKKAAVAAPLVTEGNLAKSPKSPDWTQGEERQKFDVPAYLRKQHD